MLFARVLPPLPDGQLPQQVPVSKPAGERVLEVVTPPGGLLVQRLAADLIALGYELAWVRPLPFESDSSSLASLLLAGLAAARRQSSSRQEPMVVVELPGVAQAESLLDQLLSPGVPGAFSPSVILVVDSQYRPNCAGARGVQVQVTPWPARLIQSRVSDVRQPRPPLRQLVAATRGLPSLVEGSLRILPQLGIAEFSRVLARVHEPGGLTRAIASHLLGKMSAERMAALEMAGHLGYAHERFNSLSPALADAGKQPWWVPLADGWFQMDPIWRSALVTSATQGAGLARSACLSRLVAELTEEGAIHEGIELCINAGWPGLAADLLTGEADQLISASRYATLVRWLDRLPHEDHRSHQKLAKIADELHSTAPYRRPFSEQPKPGQLAEISRDRVGHAGGGKRRWGFSRSSRSDGPEEADSADNERSSEWWAKVTLDLIARKTYQSTLQGTEPRDGIGPEYSTPFRAGERPPGRALFVEARLLGPFELLVNGQLVQHWRGNRGRMLLAYLLLHRGRPLARDELGGVFWPDASPDVVRNRLHVALYGLRRDLRALTKHPVVIHSGRGFSFHPHLDLWVDAEAFEEAVTAARQQDGARLDTTLARYETAIRLYRGELLEDTPFEEWTLLCRERLRLQHLEALDHVARLRFELGRYADCLDACHRLIPGDLCREDIHRLIMLCYTRLNQPHLAARQYHQCRRQLRDELGIEPAETTQRLYERIRRQEFV